MNTYTNTTLPDVVTGYFDATNRFDADTAAACFTSDAVVHDEGKDHVGTEAIRGWVAHASEKYQPQATVMSAQEKGDQLFVAARVTGDFPGNSADLEFAFSLRDGKIAELSIR